MLAACGPMPAMCAADRHGSAVTMRRRHTSEREQLDLFCALPGDLAARDAQDLMAYPFFSLAKSKRDRPPRTATRLSAAHRAQLARHRAPQLHAHSCRSGGGCSALSWPRNGIWGKAVNHLVLSGTATHVPSGTGSSCYRGPESAEKFSRSITCRA